MQYQYGARVTSIIFKDKVEYRNVVNTFVNNNEHKFGTELLKTFRQFQNNVNRSAANANFENEYNDNVRIGFIKIRKFNDAEYSIRWTDMINETDSYDDVIYVKNDIIEKFNIPSSNFRLDLYINNE